MVMFSSYNAMDMFSSNTTQSTNDTSVVFSVPPPLFSKEINCSVCSACGRGPENVSQHINNKLEEDRTLALQLRAAAFFNKMDVPPPNIPLDVPLQPLNVPPPVPTHHSSSYPPPSNLSFTCFPPPSVVPSFSHSYHVGGGIGGEGQSSSPSVSSTSSSLVSTGSLISQSFNGVVSVTATLSSAGMKRMSDMDSEETPMKRARPAGDTELRLLIQSKAAGSVIGKGGQNISRLRSENPASITVPDCPGPERVLTIGGSEDVVSKVLEEVLESLDEDGGDADVRMLVHHSQAGCIIGKGGSKIKELRDMCGGQVKVYTNCCPQSTDRVIQIIGDRSRILLTIGNILEALRDSPIKGVNSQYNPHNFDEFYAQEYGGWSDGPKGGNRFPPMGGRGPPQMGPGGPMGRGPMGPGGPMGGPGGPPHFNRRGGPPFNSRGSMGQSHNNDYDGGFRQGGGGGGGGKSLMNGGSPQNGESTTTQVTIPKDAAGAIIGKGGARIRKIRADSGASISIEDSRPGSNDRIITIIGTDSQIKHAQYLLQQSVREFGGPSVSGNRGRF